MPVLALCLLIYEHQDNVYMKYIPPKIPLLCGETGVYRGMHFSLISDRRGGFNVKPQSIFGTQNKNKKFFSYKIYYVFYGHVFAFMYLSLWLIITSHNIA